MRSPQTQRFRDHALWDALELLKSELEELDETSQTELTDDVLAIVTAALRCRRAPEPAALYTDIMDALSSNLSFFSVSNIQNGVAASYLTTLQTLVRQLPQVPTRELAESYRMVVDEASQSALTRFAEIEAQIKVLEETVETEKNRIEQVAQRADFRIGTRQKALSTDLSNLEAQLATVQTSVRTVGESAAATIQTDWSDELTKWREKEIADSKAHDDGLRDELGLLVAAAQIGQRLVEHAAGTLTALDWTRRATRERRTGNVLRNTAITIFAAAGVVGLWMVAEALRDLLTVGEGLLRVAVVVAITGLAGYLAAESRRHLHEADSAEEVSTVLQQMEPFLAGSESRADVRREVSDTVFVRNVLSRFSRRDAIGKQIAEQSMPEVLSALTDAVKKLTAGQKPGSG